MDDTVVNVVEVTLKSAPYTFKINSGTIVRPVSCLEQVTQRQEQLPSRVGSLENRTLAL